MEFRKLPPKLLSDCFSKFRRQFIRWNLESYFLNYYQIAFQNLGGNLSGGIHLESYFLNYYQIAFQNLGGNLSGGI